LEFLGKLWQYPRGNLNTKFQSKEYMKYSLENIAHILDFLDFCNIVIWGVDQKMNHDFKYCLSKQFQVPCNIFIPVLRAVGKTTREVVGGLVGTYFND
jgi:hypothetical protein